MDPVPPLSVVIPVHNESENIAPLAAELEAALSTLPAWECLWVDDSSTDDSVTLMQALARRDPRHRLLLFPERRGQTAALLAGFRAARGEYVAGLDGDRQNDPADLPRLLEYARAGDWDMVNGVRARRHDSLVRKISSRIANGFRNWVTGDRVTDVGCSVRVLRRSFVPEIPPLNGMHRFLPTLIRMAGGRVTEQPVAHRPRAAGRPKYGINNRLWVGIADTFAVRWMGRRRRRLEAREWRAEPPVRGAVAPERGAGGR